MNGTGYPDYRSYIVNFKKIRKILGYKTKYTITEGIREVWQSLLNDTLNPDDSRAITVEWYKHLLEMQKFLKGIEINGKLL